MTSECRCRSKDSLVVVIHPKAGASTKIISLRLTESSHYACVNWCLFGWQLPARGKARNQKSRVHTWVQCQHESLQPHGSWNTLKLICLQNESVGNNERRTNAERECRAFVNESSLRVAGNSENSQDEKRTFAKFSFVYINTTALASAVKKRSQLDGDGLLEEVRAGIVDKIRQKTNFVESDVSIALAKWVMATFRIAAK